MKYESRMYVELDLLVLGRKIEGNRSPVIYTGPKTLEKGSSIRKSDFKVKGKGEPTDFDFEGNAAEIARAGVRAYREAGYSAKGFIVRRYEVDV